MERHPHILTTSKSGLIDIDVQEKLMPAIAGADAIVQNIVRLVLGFQMFKRPILVTEQYPRGLGPTLDIIAKQFDLLEEIEKTTFSCCGSTGFLTRFNELELESVVVAEDFVCAKPYQRMSVWFNGQVVICDGNYFGKIIAMAILGMALAEAIVFYAIFMVK